MVIFAALVVACMSIVISWAGHQIVQRREPQFWDGILGDYLEVQETLAQTLTTHYQTHHNWDDSRPLLDEAQAIFDKQHRSGPWMLSFTLAGANQLVIYHVNSREQGKPLSRTDPLLIFPLQVEGEVVGYLGITPTLMWRVDRQQSKGPEEPFGLLFVIAATLLTTAALVGGSAAVFGIAMSRSLTAPLNNLAIGAKALGNRNLSQRVLEIGTDEMQAVARSFNEMADQLEEAETLRRNLLADVAHELRTPLSVLQGNLRAILDEIYPLEQDEIARLYEQTRFLSRLVTDLHELAQAEARKLPLSLQDTDLTGLIESTVETFRPGAEGKGVNLTTTLPDSLPLVQVDPSRWRQVLQNLLANALRHTPSGGTITVFATSTLEHVNMTISDTGEGMTSEQLSHIFDRFYRSDPARARDKGGAGLGLAIVRAIVESHGGSIEVHSSGVGQGSTFEIMLPKV